MNTKLRLSLFGILFFLTIGFMTLAVTISVGAQSNTIRQIPAWPTTFCIGVNGPTGTPSEDQSANGADIHIWTCNSSDSQRWEWIPVDNNHNQLEYQLKNVLSGKCMGVDGGQNATSGAQIHQWNCNSSDTQRWIYNTPGIPGGYGYLGNVFHTGMCASSVDSDGDSGYDSGEKLQLLPCYAPNGRSFYWQ